MKLTSKSLESTDQSSADLQLSKEPGISYNNGINLWVMISLFHFSFR